MKVVQLGLKGRLDKSTVPHYQGPDRFDVCRFVFMHNVLLRFVELSFV